MKKYIAAVSGGPDSMAMLNMYKDQVIGVCHIDYQKRKSSKRDKKIVKKYCNKNKIKFFCKTVFKTFYLFHKKENFQNLARKIRYEFFCKVAKKLNVDQVLVAHTLDDFIETALIQKKKKTKTLFYGIKKNGKYNDLKIFRPLLEKRKKELIKYCENNMVSFGIDETNFLEIYERNAIRKEIEKWPDKKINDFLDEIFSHNKRNEFVIKKSEKAFKQWKKANYEIVFFKLQNTSLRMEMIKKLFQQEKIKYRSEKKFIQIENFICNAQTKKQFRIGNNKHIKKLKNNIIILVKNSR